MSEPMNVDPATGPKSLEECMTLIEASIRSILGRWNQKGGKINRLIFHRETNERVRDDLWKTITFGPEFKIVIDASIEDEAG